MPEVSIILPVWNAEEYIQECINSILNQSYQNFELIIVTNGSNVPTLQAIEQIKDKRIIRFHFDQPDLIKAVNKAITESSGRYISRIDSDDIMTLHRLQLQVDFLKQNPDFAIVSGEIQYLGDQLKNRGYFLHVNWLNQLKTHEDIFLNRFVDSPVANPSLMVRKEVFERFGLYKDGPFPEDYEIVLRWLENNMKIGKIPEDVLQWRDHSGRLTRNNDRYSVESFYKIKAKYFTKWFLKHFPSKNEILVWGTGKSVRRKSRYLSDHGLKIAGYIDVKPHPSSNQTPVYHYLSIPKNIFILSFVSDRKGRVEIFNFLTKNGYQPGIDFYMMS